MKVYVGGRIFFVAAGLAVLVLALAFTRAASQSDARSLSDDPTPPSRTVSAGGYHTCAVRTDGTLACWGSDGYGLATLPAGTFSQVSAGGYHNCGVRTDGTLACWGAHGDGRTTPPAGTFSQVSAGGYHNCGVRTDGTLACWGAHGYGRTTPPSGTIVIVKATHPAGGTGFGFSDNIAAPNSFNLDDGGTKTFSDIFTDSYTVIEDYPQVAPGGFVLTGLSCTDPDDGSSVDLAARKATVDLDLGETVTCTFTNTATAVGGMVEIQVDGSHSVVDPAAQPSGGSSRQHYIALAALAVAVLAALTASAWYARRRFSRG